MGVGAQVRTEQAGHDYFLGVGRTGIGMGSGSGIGRLGAGVEVARREWGQVRRRKDRDFFRNCGAAFGMGSGSGMGLVLA